MVKIQHLIIIYSINLKMSLCVPLPMEFATSVPVTTLERGYDGSESFLGGLIGGGVAALFGGLLGPDFGATFSAFGGAMGGAGGSSKEKRNGMSVLGGAVGGSVGAGLGVKYGTKLANVIFGEQKTEEIEGILNMKGLSDSMDGVANKTLELAKPLVGLAKNTLEDVAKPLENITEPLESIAKPLESVAKPLEELNPLKIMPRQLDLVTTPLALGAGTFSTLLSGFNFSSMVKPLLDASTSGVLGAIGGGIGAYFGSWGLDAIHNLF